MPELTDGDASTSSVTSPPYWQIKDYGSPGQIGFGQSLHEYLRDLQRVWAECFRVLHEGGRLCVNIGDQFARASLFGRYRVIPLHAEIICQCAETGFDFMGSIVWRKKTTMNTTGGAVVMGSYPYPPNGIVEIDFEYILIFKKPGTPRAPAREVKARSALTKEEWKSWFSGHWDVAGARKNGHEAPFPDEIPRRLIRMFSFPGDTVLDPFVGTGTTARVALAQGRNAVGYEIQADFLPARRRPLGGRRSSRPRGRTRWQDGEPRAPSAAAARHAAARRPRVPDMVPDPRAERPPATAGAGAPHRHRCPSRLQPRAGLRHDRPVSRAGDPGHGSRPGLPPRAGVEEEGLPQGREPGSGGGGQGEDHPQEQDFHQRTAREIRGGPGRPAVREVEGTWCTGSGTRSPRVDKALFVAWNAEVAGNVTLAEETSVWFSATLRGDIEPITIGRGSNVQDGATLHVDFDLPCVVGERVTIGHQAILHGCTVGDDCLIGMGAVVLSGAVIGKESVVGAGALVTEGKSFRPGP